MFVYSIKGGGVLFTTGCKMLAAPLAVNGLLQHKPLVPDIKCCKRHTFTKIHNSVKRNTLANLLVAISVEMHPLVF